MYVIWRDIVHFTINIFRNTNQSDSCDINGHVLKITIVLEELHTLSEKQYQKNEKKAVEIIATILNSTPEDKIVSVIKGTYDGMEAIKCDINSANELIIQVNNIDK